MSSSANALKKKSWNFLLLRVTNSYTVKGKLSPTRMRQLLRSKLNLVQSRPQSSSLLRMTDDGNSSGQSDFRSSADWLLKHNSITTGSEDDTGVNKDG